ncbi:hypothetical protein Gorai_001471, partial [Gossypium raimondii]|nr:hypothetical protein [Gossypium raimondii]
ADTFLWRNKKISAGVLGVATVIWVLFELLEYHLLTLVCHVLIFALVILFLWSNAYAFINKSPLCIPEVHIPKDPVIEFAEALRFETNLAFTVFRDIASGRELKKFLYVFFVLLHTVPVLYEKYEDKVDPFAEKAMHEIKKQYAVFNANVLSKIPRGPSKEKKKD